MARAKTKRKSRPSSQQPPAADREQHTPTPASRKQVEAMQGFGVPQDQIAATLGISGTQLRLKYRTELTAGLAKANALVGESLFKMATGSPATFDGQGRKIREEQSRVPAAAIFWAKTKMGFKETFTHEHGGTKGAPAIPLRLDGLSLAQLDQLIERIDVAIETFKG